ncbi:hypothetical protein TL16_g09843 [Triparma laevis f. inornata]|uniref:Uncharacterized protein n=1 Tax=Triparma laevis f. inornata TaxID=1714386 RepID=A0A9W7ENG3_9STRA|nr:hypothetical protein TL16_g09843 [Triparma laevis f. inornata]
MKSCDLTDSRFQNADISKAEFQDVVLISSSVINQILKRSAKAIINGGEESGEEEGEEEEEEEEEGEEEEGEEEGDKIDTLKLPDHIVNNPDFEKAKAKLKKGVESKEAKIVTNLITAATGFSVQKNANLYDLQNKMKGERALSILNAIFSDPQVHLALGLAEQLSHARSPPKGLVSVCKNGLGGQMKSNFYEYRKQIEKEQVTIERISMKQRHIVALGISLFTSILIGFFGFISNILSEVVLGN